MKKSTHAFSSVLCILLAVVILVGAFSGCEDPPEPLDPVTLTVAGAWEDCRAIEAVGRAFTALYPNCTVEYEYLQDYSEALSKRMTGDNVVDIFFTNNIQSDSPMLPYAQELLSCDGLDLSLTFDGLIDNFKYFGDSDSGEEKLYALPLGAVMRGIFINKTLLSSLNIAIPTNQAELLAACQTLKDNGFIAFHGNPGDFAQQLLYPWVCNIIANADDPQAAHERVNSRSDNLGEMFSEPFEFLYTLIENGYYDYKRAQNDGLFKDASDTGYSLDFLNICKVNDVYEKVDDIGRAAFLPSTMSLLTTLDRLKEDYHSEIEYMFVPAPVGPEGAYAYMSPANGIAANKNSADVEWSIKFLNFLFTPENNEQFAEEFGIIPNTEGAFDYISTLFDLPDDHISHLGEVTFDYGFYGIITGTLLDISKGNNPKYMQQNADGTTSLYPLEYYVDAFEEEIRGDAK